jgi:hypothetical protein
VRGAAFGERLIGLVSVVFTNLQGENAARAFLEEPDNLQFPWNLRRRKATVTGPFIHALEPSLKEEVIVNGKHKSLHMNHFERNARRVRRLRYGGLGHNVYLETFVPNRRNGYKQLIHGIFQFCADTQNV